MTEGLIAQALDKYGLGAAIVVWVLVMLRAHQRRADEREDRMMDLFETIVGGLGRRRNKSPRRKS